jgi:hypothetical protein|tara:strand:- start:435 stop:632 length:198 start_codon:yes stop_codon:yes gene_type:complete
MSFQGLQGKTKYEAMRKSKTYETGRVCSKDGCTTGISMYNKKDTCFNHSAKSYGRVRGHIDPRTR